MSSTGVRKEEAEGDSISPSALSGCPQLPGAFLKENGARALISSHLQKHSSRKGFTSRKLPASALQL